MYCPSCDKSYGAIHSRCPECHSWLKVSAPSSQRSKGGKIGGAPSSTPHAVPDENRSVVGTMDRSSSVVGWADPEPSTPSGAWGDPPSADSSGGWSTGDLGSPAMPAAASAAASAAPLASPKTEEWTDTGNGWGGESSPSPLRKSANNGWLDSGDSEDGWSGGGLSAETPVAKTAPPAPAKGWLGDPEPTAPPVGPGKEASGWLGSSAGAPEALKAPSGSGWLGEGADRAEAGGGGGGWLGDSASHATPSMAEMVDHAIGAKEDDDFVDDSWVDEEIRDNEFDELEVPEYLPSSPEAGGLFLKMLLVAVLVVLVGGGVMFLRSDTLTPEQIAAEATEKRLSFGRLAAEGGKADLAAGKATLAIPQFQEALVALSEGKAPQNEVYDTEVLLGRALMSANEYEEAFKHWKSLQSSGQEKYVAEAKKGLDDTKRQLRITANEYLKEAKQYASKGEINSVKRLGKDALDIYKAYGGDQSQIGNAHGIIGRGFMNGREYAVARDHLKKAVALAPNLGYQTLLSQVNRELQPQTYLPPIQYQQSSSPAQSAAPARSTNTPSFDLGSPSYRTNNRPVSSGGRSSASSGNNNNNATNSSGAATAAPPKMQEIPIHRPTQRNPAGNQRKGSKGVLQGY